MSGSQSDAPKQDFCQQSYQQQHIITAWTTTAALPESDLSPEFKTMTSMRFSKTVVIYQRLPPAACFLAAQKMFRMSCMLPWLDFGLIFGRAELYQIGKTGDVHIWSSKLAKSYGSLSF
ncbi:hypothetical protein AYI83_20945 [Shewanella algae]|nr:hypothetical protein AYI83_20945 [Shewanella algae]